MHYGGAEDDKIHTRSNVDWIKQPINGKNGGIFPFPATVWGAAGSCFNATPRTIATVTKGDQIATQRQLISPHCILPRSCKMRLYPRIPKVRDRVAYDHRICDRATATVPPPALSPQLSDVRHRVSLQGQENLAVRDAATTQVGFQYSRIHGTEPDT
jgi:hypothetical protein